VRFATGLLLGFAFAALVLARRSNAGDEPEWIAAARDSLRAAFDAQDPVAALPPGLDRVWATVRKQRPSAKRPAVLATLLDLIERAARSNDLPVRVAAWRAAGACASPAGLAILSKGLEGAESEPELVIGVMRAARDSGSQLVCTWFVVQSGRVLACVQGLPGEKLATGRVAFAQTLHACAAMTSAGRAQERRAMTAALEEALRSSSGGLQATIGAALARTPGRATRKILRNWLGKTKNPSTATLVALADNLPLAGDAESVPLLLALVPGTPEPVLESALIALSSLEPGILRKQGKTIVRETAKIADENYLELRLLTARPKRSRAQESRFALLTARRRAWTTPRIVDKPPRPLPPGAQAVVGITALWWRIVDVNANGMRPPPPSKRAGVRYLAHRANLTWAEWMTWCKRGR